MKYLLILSCFFLCSCAMRYRPSGVMQYKVTQVKKYGPGSDIKLEGVKSTFQVPSDTLEVGDTITVNWIKRIR